MSFCEQLQKRRKELGLSRTELAARLGVSPSAVGNYETGVSAPKEEVLLRLFDALEVDPNYLYRGSFRHIGGIQSDEERKLLEKYRRLPLSGRQTVHTLVDALDIMVAEEQRLRPRQERRTIRCTSLRRRQALPPLYSVRTIPSSPWKVTCPPAQNSPSASRVTP